MKVKFLGVGSAFYPDLGNTSILINDRVLIDCGSTVPAELMRLKKIEEITDIIITHLHSDHVGGLELLGQIYYYALKKRPRLWLTETMRRDLWEKVLRGGLEYSVSPVGSILKCELETYFNLEWGITPKPGVVGCYEVNTPDVSIMLELTEHVPGMESYSMITDDGVIYSSDIKHCLYDQGYAIEEFDGLKAIFHDCSLVDLGVQNVHPYIESLLEGIPEEYRGITWFVHYGNQYKDWEEKIQPLGFPGFVRKGQDFIF